MTWLRVSFAWHEKKKFFLFVAVLLSAVKKITRWFFSRLNLNTYSVSKTKKKKTHDIKIHVTVTRVVRLYIFITRILLEKSIFYILWIKPRVIYMFLETKLRENISFACSSGGISLRLFFLRLRRYRWCLPKWRYHDGSSTFTDMRRNQFRPESTYLTQPCHRLLFFADPERGEANFWYRLASAYTLFLFSRLPSSSPFLLQRRRPSLTFSLSNTPEMCLLCRRKSPFWETKRRRRHSSIFSRDAPGSIQIKCNKEVEEHITHTHTVFKSLIVRLTLNAARDWKKYIKCMFFSCCDSNECIYIYIYKKRRIANLFAEKRFTFYSE